MESVGHKTESIYRRYTITDEAMLRDASARLAVLHQAERENSQSTAKVSEDSGPQARRPDRPTQSQAGIRLVAWDGVEPPTRGFSVGSAPQDHPMPHAPVFRLSQLALVSAVPSCSAVRLASIGLRKVEGKRRSALAPAPRRRRTARRTPWQLGVRPVRGCADAGIGTFAVSAPDVSQRAAP